jgi:hypothetical protein
MECCYCESKDQIYICEHCGDEVCYFCSIFDNGHFYCCEHCRKEGESCFAWF